MQKNALVYARMPPHFPLTQAEEQPVTPQNQQTNAVLLIPPIKNETTTPV